MGTGGQRELFWFLSAVEGEPRTWNRISERIRLERLPAHPDGSRNRATRLHLLWSLRCGALEACRRYRDATGEEGGLTGAGAAAFAKARVGRFSVIAAPSFDGDRLGKMHAAQFAK